MPLRNALFGIYKLAYINTSLGYRPILTSSLTNSRTMEANATSYLQGTPETRILNIGNISETYNFSAPILIGNAAALDGRSLLLLKINEALNYDSCELPILTSADLNISKDQGGTVSFNMESDGLLRKQNPPFVVANPSRDADNFPNIPPELDPPTRVSRAWDFRVSIGKLKFLVQDAKFNFKVSVSKTNFLGAIENGQSTNNELYEYLNNIYNGQNDTLDFQPCTNDELKAFLGTQYPYLGVSSVSVDGSGTAAQLLKSTVTLQNNNQNIIINSDPDDINTFYGADILDVTWQKRGCAITEDTDLKFELAQCNNGVTTWIDLLDDSNIYNNITPPPYKLTFSKLVINSLTFNYGTDLLTVSFNFTAYLKTVKRT